MKFCKDCEHYRYGRMIYHSTCIESYKNVDLISGNIFYNSADVMRATKCGLEAKLFEQKISWFKKWFRK